MDGEGSLSRARTDAWETTRIPVTRVSALRATRRLPPSFAALVEAFERAVSLKDGVSDLEHGLVEMLELENVMIVWMDWPRRIASSLVGRVSPRLQELTPIVAGSGRRVVLGNAVIEPIGPAPARAVLVMKGAAERVFDRHMLRVLPRVAARIAPTLERLLAGR
jgi:hypothetical protein